MAPLFRLLAGAAALAGLVGTSLRSSCAVLTSAAAQSDGCPTTSPVNIQSSGDASSAFSNCAVFGGSVVINTVASGVIDLGALKYIKGDLTMIGATNVTTLSATFLQTIGGTFTVQNIVLLASINMPALATVGDLTFEGLPNLATLTMNLSQINNFNVQNTFLPALPSINATTITSINVANNKQLNQMTFSVTTVTNSIDIEANGPSFTVNFPNLISAQNITFRGCSDIEIPSLSNVTGSLGFYESGLTVISAPNFTATANQGTLAINANPSLTNVSFPMLKTVAGGVQIQNNTILKDLEFDSLQTIGGAIDFYGAFDR
jgi:hypothetical protein